MTRPARDERADRVRVGREEREAVVTALQDHYAAERLDDDELTSRVHQALTATTRADLAELVEDLPTDRPQREQPSRGHVRPWRLTSAVTIVAGAVLAVAGVVGGAFASPTVHQPQDRCLSTGQLTGHDAGCPDATAEQLRIFDDVARADRAAEQLQDLVDQNPDRRLQGLVTRARVAAERAEAAGADARQMAVTADGQPSKKAMAALAETSTEAAGDAQRAVAQALDRIEGQ